MRASTMEDREAGARILSVSSPALTEPLTGCKPLLAGMDSTCEQHSQESNQAQKRPVTHLEAYLQLHLPSPPFSRPESHIRPG